MDFQKPYIHFLNYNYQTYFIAKINYTKMAPNFTSLEVKFQKPPS